MSDTDTVLVVDDEPAYVDAYEAWLEDAYAVRTATGGEAALEALDATVDVVLLDRRMPGRSGDEVLTEIRDRPVDPRVAMLTAVEPQVDIVGMPFDEYLTKPVSRDELLDAVETLLVRDELDDRLQECFALASKKSLLESTIDPAELEESEEYHELRARLDVLEAEVDETIGELIESGAVAGAYLDIEG